MGTVRTANFDRDKTVVSYGQASKDHAVPEAG
jgi:hypothetical protein